MIAEIDQRSPRPSCSISIFSRIKSRPLHFLELFLDTLVEVPDELGNPNSQRLANPQQRRHGDRPSCFDLLPVPGRKAERNHILLTVAPLAAQGLDPLPEGPEEFLLIRHLPANTLTRAEVPRAD
jgi:hypothetical protein